MSFTFVYTPPEDMEPLAVPVVGESGHLTHHENLDRKIVALNDAVTDGMDQVLLALTDISSRLSALEGPS